MKLRFLFPVAVFASVAYAQTPIGTTTAPKTSPFTVRLPGGLLTDVQNPVPAREVKLVEKPADQLSNTQYSKDGTAALAIDPQKWKHAETENFILHYRRVTEAQKVAREIEYTLWYVASFLGATKEKYSKKSHVYVFEDDDEWKEFLKDNSGMAWSKSFAHGDDLYLNIRGGGNTGSGSFDFLTLAHEVTHAVVYRLNSQTRWPQWLNEGFAEFMATSSLAGKHSAQTGRFVKYASFSIEELGGITQYPSDPVARQRLYQTSERLVRYINTELPADRFRNFVKEITGGKTLKDALLYTYSDKIKSWEDLEKRFEKFR